MPIIRIPNDRGMTIPCISCFHHVTHECKQAKKQAHKRISQTVSVFRREAASSEITGWSNTRLVFLPQNTLLHSVSERLWRPNLKLTPRRIMFTERSQKASTSQFSWPMFLAAPRSNPQPASILGVLKGHMQPNRGDHSFSKRRSGHLKSVATCLEPRKGEMSWSSVI